MTDLSDLVEDCRQRYNAIGDQFFNDQEIIDLIYEAEMEMSLETRCLESVYTVSTVDSQREYDYPTAAFEIFRVTFNDERLQPIDFLDDDTITGSDEGTSSTGDPRYYAIFADKLYLRPVPSNAQTLKVYSYDAPTELTSILSTLNLPERYRLFTKDYVLSQMFAKDKNSNMVGYHEGRWQKHIDRVKRNRLMSQVGDMYPVVKNIDAQNIYDIDRLP